jgi:hypothetical protein
MLCGCSDADPDRLRVDYSSMSPECDGYHRQYAAYLDKLEASGRFSSEKMDCFRHRAALLVRGYHLNRTPDLEERLNASCREGTKLLLDVMMKKAEEIPNLSQEEFDADWGKMVDCREVK